MSDNGFVDFQNILKNIKVDQATIDRSLKAGAEEYVRDLRPKLPSDPDASMSKKYGQMKNNLKVIKSGNDVAVTFGDSFWWRFVDKGTPKIAPRNFTRSTLNADGKRITTMMKNKTLKEMGL